MAKMQSTTKISARGILMGIVSIVVFALLLSSVAQLLSKYIAIRKHIYTLKQEQSALELKKDKISSMNDYINTPEGQERIFRDKYRLVKPGEGMIVVTNEEASSEAETYKKPAIKRFWDSILRGLGLI